MERIVNIHAACGRTPEGEQITEEIFEETFNNLVSLGCEHDREIVLKGQMIYVYKTVYVDTIVHCEEPIKLL